MRKAVTTVTTTSSQTTRARGLCYRFLSACYCLPEDDFLGSEEFEAFSAALGELGSEATGAAEDLARAYDETERQALRIEYSRLFIGPFKLPAPPYGSCYLDDGRQLMGDSTLDVVKRYQEAGVDVESGKGDVPDHIGIELEFMGYLVQLEDESAGDDDTAGLRDTLAKQASFLEKHLCAWVPIFAEKLAEDTDSEFYKSLVAATDTFLAEDLARVREAREQL